MYSEQSVQTSKLKIPVSIIYLFKGGFFFISKCFVMLSNIVKWGENDPDHCGVKKECLPQGVIYTKPRKQKKILDKTCLNLSYPVLKHM